MSQSVYIKNMVCPRCIASVTDIFGQMDIEIEFIQLGEVKTKTDIGTAQRQILQTELSKNGFELLEDQKSRMISKIKSIVIEQIHHSNKSMIVNFSTLLTEKLNHDYSSLSRLFSSVEGVTIERFVLKQKIERVKELLFYDELTLSQIAHKMDYSSVAHLSSQFKKETGMTPSAFKKMKEPQRKGLDRV